MSAEVVDSEAGVDRVGDERQSSPGAEKQCQQQQTSVVEEQLADDAAAATSAAEEKQSDSSSSQQATSRKRAHEDSEPVPKKVARTELDDTSKDSNVPSDLSTTSKNRDNVNATDSNQHSGQSTVPADHTNIVASHYNQLEEKGLSQRNQSRIIHMRNFNNWLKSTLIKEYIDKTKQKKSLNDPLKVLDMCCGKGGDLYKWRDGYVTHVIFADIAAVSVEQCQARYRDLGNRRYPPLYTAEFLAYDCTKVRLREKYKDVTVQLDLVSCQFAFHYSFESLQQAECMFKNASESLKAGGYFIGTIPNAYELMSRYHKADGKKIGNEIYSIEFQFDKNDVPLFGAKYHFHLEGVVDCPEFLVYPPMFEKLAWKYGLELVMFEKFEDYYERQKNDGKTRLGKMQALETYPPSQDVPLRGKVPEDYQHAIEYMQSSTGHRKIGTLSQAEWDAITLYSVFAFQKAKTHWNAEGKPEYIKT
ncbi:hypothetical protein TKK_0008461 [Trichogramma kaykai]|uniref:mRNA cap guanine-N(7) methyltransferase n=1 Tax=Trichogramma kaykai TaxID=54128 RepID=A0ABD2X6H1_9HYME